MTSDADLIAQAASMIRAQDLYGWSSEHDRVVLDALDAFLPPDAEGKGTTPGEKAPATGTTPKQKAPVPVAFSLPPGWVAIPLEPTAEQWTVAQGTLLDCGWDAVTCLAARIQALIAITRDQWRRAVLAAQKGEKS